MIASQAGNKEKIEMNDLIIYQVSLFCVFNTKDTR